MPEIDEIADDLRNINQIIADLRRLRTEIFDSRNLATKNSFKDYLMDAKTKLLSLKTRMRGIPAELSAPPVEKIDDLVTALDEMHKDLNHLPLGTIEDEVDTMQRVFSTIRGVLPYPLLTVQMDLPTILPTLHKSIRSEVSRDFEEVMRCYSAQSYRGCLAFCARVAEIVLRRKYYEKKRRQHVSASAIEAEIGHLTLGQLISKCRDVGMMNTFQGLDEYSGILNRVRVPSVHVTIRPYDPSPNVARGAIEFTLALIREVTR